MDFGHKQDLDRLVNDKKVLSLALERVVRQQQVDDEQVQEEKMKVKREAQLFKRHTKQIEIRARQKKTEKDPRGLAAARNVLEPGLRGTPHAGKHGC